MIAHLPAVENRLQRLRGSVEDYDSNLLSDTSPITVEADESTGHFYWLNPDREHHPADLDHLISTVPPKAPRALRNLPLIRSDGHLLLKSGR